MIYIPTEEIKQPQLHADTLGFTFVWNGHFLRGIYQDSEQLAKSYFDSGFLNEVMSRGLFPKTWVSEFHNEQFAMILEHEMIGPVLYATEWNSAMLKDAALMVLDIAEIGWRYGYNMVDCHKLNVMFHNNRPLYVDLGSFVPRKKGCTGWKPYGNFLESYTYILDMWTSGCKQIAKRMMSPGVVLHSEDYWVWKRPIYRVCPKWMGRVQQIKKLFNALAISEAIEANRIKNVAKVMVNIFKPTLSQHFNRLRKGVNRMKINYTPCVENIPIQISDFILPLRSLTCINVSNPLLLDTLQMHIQSIVSLNENDSSSNAEYLMSKNIVSLSYSLMNGGILVRGKFPETRFQSEAVLAYCTDKYHGQFALHNILVYLEACMNYSITGKMYVLLSKPHKEMVDMLSEKWNVKRVSEDETLIEVNKLH